MAKSKRSRRYKKLRATAGWLAAGGLFGYFVLHPITMFFGFFMTQSGFTHDHNSYGFIVSKSLKASFSLEMLPWSLTFVIASALVGHFYGKAKQLQNKLWHLSNMDGLTGIANRRHFGEILDREWRHGARVAKPISLIMCDIDFFKAYNDTYGHQSGDECLQQVASALSATLQRPRDIVARYGGEEFVVILPDTDAKGAFFVAEAIRAKVESLQIAHHKSRASSIVTISLGVATIRPDQDSAVAALISAADQALYEAKKEGRNRAKCADLAHQMQNAVNRE